MSKCDFYVQAVEAIYASGADSGRVPEALEAISRLLGGRGATLEVIDKATQRPIEFHSAGLPSSAGARYFDHFAALNSTTNCSTSPRWHMTPSIRNFCPNLTCVTSFRRWSNRRLTDWWLCLFNEPAARGMSTRRKSH